MENHTLKFKIINGCFQNASSYPSDGADFFLEKDYWNDYSFYTTYHLHATPKLTRGKSQYLGVIKILKLGQKENQSDVLTKELNQKNLPTIILELPDDFYSISFSLDLYRGLKKYLNEKERRRFVKSMRMILDMESTYYRDVKNEMAFQVSFLRDADMNSDVLKRGKMLLYNEGDYHNWEEEKLSITFTEALEPITLDFSRIKNCEDINDIPSGVIVFIGHNGCGKSTALYQIAKVLFASPSDRWAYKEKMTIEPNSIGINKLIFFSYSAFDNFVLPGLTLSDYRLIVEGLEDNKGRFVFCGIRDVKTEMNNYISKYEKKKMDKDDTKTSDFKPIDNVVDNHQNNILLKNVNLLADEMESAYNEVVKHNHLYQMLSDVIQDCGIYLPSLYNDVSWLLNADIMGGMKETFLKKSTGVKFFIHSLLHLIAYTEENSIILFDEPENHLHPPFLSLMMKSFRRVIHQKHSVMLVSTHSPVILQETLSKNVFVLRRDNGVLNFSKPQIETYGESFGIINSSVFNLNTDITTYYNVIDQLYDKWICDELKSSAEVINRFHTRLGIDFFSSQLEAYLINKYYNSHVDS